MIDHKVSLENNMIDGYHLQIGRRLVGEIAELDDKFVVVKNGSVESIFKSLEQAVENIIENYNLNN
ncbi:DUF2969 domain-containing protein [Streptococcus uberis]|nr:DUF2969 domain-containing protein [Streptococcus uberis]